MGTRILVVDDEIDTLQLLRTILEISGYEPITTLNSVDAITLAEAEKPDVVLLDIMMPKLDGFTLCKMMRLNPTTKNLPIVFVTAYEALDIEDRRVEAGADQVIHKPINMDTLISAVSEATTKTRVASVSPPPAEKAANGKAASPAAPASPPSTPASSSTPATNTPSSSPTREPDKPEPKPKTP